MESKAKLVGHPVHPMLIPFPLGLLGMAVIFDLLVTVADWTSLAEASHPMIAAGIISGLLAAVPGFIDRAAIPSGTRAKAVATAHGFGNLLVLALFAAAWFIRRDNPSSVSGAPIILELVGLLGVAVFGWLGGELVGRLGVGVDPSANLDAPNSLSG